MTTNSRFAPALRGLLQAGFLPATKLIEITSQLFLTRMGGYTLGALTSPGEDAYGELYLAALNGNVFKIPKDGTEHQKFSGRYSGGWHIVFPAD